MAEVALAAATVFAAAAVSASLPVLVRRAPAGGRLTPSLVILTGGAAITFAAWLAFDIRCGHHCEPARGSHGVASLERWWRRHDSWQWSAELTIAAAALAVAALAFALAARGAGRARAALWAARLAYAAWIVLVFAPPAVYELVRS